VRNLGGRRFLVELACRLWVRVRIGAIWVDGFPVLQSARPTVLVSNHVSILDTPIAVTLMSATNRDWSVWASERITNRYGFFLGRSFIPVRARFGSFVDLVRTSDRFLESSRKAVLLVHPQGDHYQIFRDVDARGGAAAIGRDIADVDFVVMGVAFGLFRIDRPCCQIALRKVPAEHPTAKKIVEALALAVDLSGALLSKNLSTVEKMV
jgi:hypothetical protein